MCMWHDRSGGFAHRRLLAGEDDDPLGGVVNLFDVAMVFAVALLLALVSTFHLAVPGPQKADADHAAAPTPMPMDVMQRESKAIEHYRPSHETLGGDGERLGIAYRLKSGEIVYVPDTGPKKSD